MQRRIFLVDPACVQTTGHNLNSLLSFGNALRAQGDIKILTCRYLEYSVAYRTGVHGFFEWYYPNIFTKAQFPTVASLRSTPVGIDPIGKIAEEDARRFFATFNANSADLVVFPSGDIYGILGILRAMADRPLEERPRLCIRLINVMEHAAPGIPEPREMLLDQLRLAMTRGYSISISAETAPYASYLASRLAVEVPVTPLPIKEECIPLPATTQFTVGHLGTTRGDKGFFHLLRVVQAVRKLEGTQHIRFLIQAPPERDALKTIGYVSQLYALPGVEFVNDSLDRHEWIGKFRECHCIVLPYDVETYALRGSAIASEAIQLGRPVLTLSGVGFAPDIAHYGVGVSVPSLDDFAPTIRQLSEVPHSQLEYGMKYGLRRLSEDSNRAYSVWLNG